jgi:hypothetical protein
LTGTNGGSSTVEGFVTRAKAMNDDDRLALARARRALDESFQVGAWKAANEVAMGRAAEYLEVRVRLGGVYVPDHLEELVMLGSRADPAERAEWQDVARLVRAALDEATLAHVGLDTLRPPDVRALIGPWKAMLKAAYVRETDQTS